MPGPRRATYKKKAKKRVTRSITRNLAVGFPDRVTLKMKYSDIITVTTGVSGNVVYSFRGNSIYDPDYTGTGHQPLYHDNYQAIYQRYVVKGCRIDLKAVNHGGTDSVIVMCVASTDLFGTSDINAQSTLEQDYAKRTQILPVGSNSPSSLSMYMSTSRIMGLRKNQVYSDDLFGAHFGATPADVWYYNIGAMAMAGTASQSIRFQVLLTYDVECFDALKQSTN